MPRKIDTDPAQMYDNMEFVLNSGEYGAGITDAFAHIGQLIAGDIDPLTVQDVQDELLKNDPDGAYTKGYTQIWSEVGDLITDAVNVLTPTID